MKSFPIPALLAALCLLAIPGCDDPDARERANTATSSVNEVKAELDRAKKQNESTAASIAEVEKRLLKHVDERMDKLAEDLANHHKKLLEQLSIDTKANRESAAALADSGRADSAKELAANKAMVAENMQNIRNEMTAELEKLRQFMDNKLKDTYPYAYQPKRMDPATPPGNGTSVT